MSLFGVAHLIIHFTPLTQCQLNCWRPLIIWIQTGCIQFSRVGGNFPQSSSANTHLCHPPVPKLQACAKRSPILGPQKSLFREEILENRYMSSTIQIASHCCVIKLFMVSVCQCELCGSIYYSLLLESHTVHNWWQGIWEMYECCNLLLAPSKTVKLIKCGAGWRLSHFDPSSCL